MVSIITSVYPEVHGVKTEKNRIGDKGTVLAEVLREHGYFTGAVVSSQFMTDSWGFDRGFDFFNKKGMSRHGGITSIAATHFARKFLEEQGKAPFFLMVHYFDPHATYIEHGKFDFSSQLGYDGQLYSGIPLADVWPIINEKLLTTDDVSFLRAHYDSEVAFTDMYVGLLLEKLKEMNLFDNTLIILTSDHGEEFWEHKYLEHSRTLFEELIHVPLIVKMPNSVQGETFAEPVSILDVFPTVLDALSLPEKKDIAGISLLKPESSGVDRIMFASTYRNGDKMSALSGHLKVVRTMKTGSDIFYNLKDDPKESTYLIETDNVGFPRLRQALDKWVEISKTQTSSENVELTEELTSGLRDLGYIK